MAGDMTVALDVNVLNLEIVERIVEAAVAVVAATQDVYWPVDDPGMAATGEAIWSLRKVLEEATA
jgi:hypothetical protein